MRALTTGEHKLTLLAVGLEVRCVGVPTKRGDPRCCKPAVYRATASYITGSRGRKGQRSSYYCLDCAKKWARWMKIPEPIEGQESYSWDEADEQVLEAILSVWPATVTRYREEARESV